MSMHVHWWADVCRFCTSLAFVWHLDACASIMWLDAKNGASKQGVSTAT